MRRGRGGNGGGRCVREGGGEEEWGELDGVALGWDQRGAEESVEKGFGR